jgi:hypothetical protein
VTRGRQAKPRPAERALELAREKGYGATKPKAAAVLDGTATDDRSRAKSTNR